MKRKGGAPHRESLRASERRLGALERLQVDHAPPVMGAVWPEHANIALLPAMQGFWHASGPRVRTNPQAAWVIIRLIVTADAGTMVRGMQTGIPAETSRKYRMTGASPEADDV